MGKNLNSNVWGSDNGKYRDNENVRDGVKFAKTSLSFGEDGSIRQVDRYEFNDKGQHNHAWDDWEDGYSDHRDEFR